MLTISKPSMKPFRRRPRRLVVVVVPLRVESAPDAGAWCQHTKFEQETLAGEQLRREERELEMMQVKDMLKSFQEEVLGRLGNVENEVTAMKDAVATHTSLVESLQSVRWRWCIPADAEAYI